MLSKLTGIYDAPIWNSQLHIPSPCSSIGESTVMFEIMDYNTVGPNGQKSLIWLRGGIVLPISTFKSTSETIIVYLSILAYTEPANVCFPLKTAVWYGGMAHEQGCGKDDGHLTAESRYWLQFTICLIKDITSNLTRGQSQDSLDW